VRGKEVTPFLLDYFRRETQGESLELNKKIILQNARLAARIAVTVSALDRER
jgi:pseudouridylate synthase